MVCGLDGRGEENTHGTMREQLEIKISRLRIANVQSMQKTINSLYISLLLILILVSTWPRGPTKETKGSI